MPFFNFLWRYRWRGVIFPICTTPIPGPWNEQLCVRGAGTRCGLSSFVPRQIHQETRRWQAGSSTYWRASRWHWRKSPNFKWPTAVILIRICIHYLYIASRRIISILYTCTKFHTKYHILKWSSAEFGHPWLDVHEYC